MSMFILIQETYTVTRKEFCSIQKVVGGGEITPVALIVTYPTAFNAMLRKNQQNSDIYTS